MFILIFLFLTLPLQAAELIVEQARVDHTIRLKQIEVLQAERALVRAQLDKRSEDDIKKHKETVKKAAEDMLFTLAQLKETHIKLEDIDFCLARKPDVNALNTDLLTPLMSAVQNNITVVRELMRAGADVNYDEWTTALELASESNFGKKCTMHILREAGATSINRSEEADSNDEWVDSSDEE